MANNEANTLQKSCIEYHVQQEKRSAVNIEKSKDELKELLYAHVMVMGVLEEIIKKYMNVPGQTNKNISEKLWLIAAFYQGIGTCEELIKQGRYTLAAPILRQEYEIVAKISELNSGRYDKKKTANPKSLSRLRPIYGDLSELSHLLKDVDENIFKEEEQLGIVGVRLVPVFDKGFCESLYGIHIFLILHIIFELDSLYSEMYGHENSAEHIEYINTVISILVERGIIKTETQKEEL